MTDDVNISFGADIAGLISGTQQVKESINEVNEQVEKAEELFKYLGERMLEVFALHEIADFVEKTSEIGENIERIGAMTGLSVEKIQTLQYAMKSTGGSAEEAGLLITRFERNVATAASGSGTAYEAFQKLGVSLGELKTLSIDQLLERTAEGFKNVADPVERAALASEVGSRGFAQLLPAILANKDGIGGFHDRLTELNDDLSDRTVQALSETHRNLTDLSTAASGAGVQAMLTFKGAIDGLLQDVTAAIVDIGKFIGFMRELQVVVGVDLIKVFGRFRQAIEDTGAEAVLVGEKVIIRWKEVGAIISEVATLHWSEIGSLQQEANTEIAEATKKATTALKNYQKEYDDLSTSATKAAGAILAADKAIAQEQPTTPSNRQGNKTVQDDNADLDYEKELINTKLELAKLGLQGEKDALDAEVAAGKITNAQKLAALQDYTTLEYQANLDALSQEQALYTEDEVEYQKVLDKKEILTAKYNNDIAKLTTDSIKSQNQEYKSFFTSIQQASNQMVNGVLQGTQTWKQAMGRLFDDLLLKFIDDFVVKAVVNWAEAQVEKIGITRAFNQVMVALGIEGATEDEAGQKAIRAAGNAATIASDGALTFAGVFANLAPILGPAAAGPAAASEGLVLAQAPQASLAVGAWNVPTDLVAQLHAGEMVVPTTFAQGIRDGGGDSGSSPVIVNFSISAIDTQSGAQFLKQNATTIAQVIAAQTRNLNSNLSPAWKN